MARQPCMVLVSGDFNALREELVHGNGETFFAAAGVAAVRPPLKRPVSEIMSPPDPPVASMTADGCALTPRALSSRSSASLAPHKR